MKETEYKDINTLLDAISLFRSSKIKEYDNVGRIAVQSQKALESLRNKSLKTKETCRKKATVSK